MYRFACAMTLMAGMFGLHSWAADWPQWRGPNRDGISSEKVLTSFPPGGPKLLWSYTNAGKGYSAPVIVGNVMYNQGSTGDENDAFVFALDTKTGQEIWKSPVPPGKSDYKLNSGWGGGPRGSPTIDGDYLYALGVKGDLVCMERANGKIVWQKNLSGDLKGQLQKIWGYSESPLIDGDLLICSPGGSQGTMAALNKKTGEVVWRSTDITDEAAYSSAIALTVDGTKMYVTMTANGVIGVDAKSGKQIFKSGIAANGIAVIPTPIFADGFLYVTSDYGSGCGLLKLTASGASEVYQNKEMQNHHGGVIKIGNYLYGCSGNSNGRVPLVCQDFKTGKRVWEQEVKGMGSMAITAANGHLYCYSQNDGTLLCVEASPKGFKEKGRFKIPKQSAISRGSGKIWAHPVIADGKLYLRDLDLVYCYDIRASK